MAMGSELERLGGYPFEVRHSYGSLKCARAAADVAADAYVYFCRLFSGIEPDIAIIVANEADWESRQPYGLPFFNDDDDQIRPGIVVMPAGTGDFWVAMGQDLREASPHDYPKLLTTYPDGAGGLQRVSLSTHRLLWTTVFTVVLIRRPAAPQGLPPVPVQGPVLSGNTPPENWCG